jgi:flagellar protein FlbD
VIEVTRMNGKTFFLNPELIQSVEGTPDTIITLVNNTKFIVKESPDEVVSRFIQYRRRIVSSLVLEQKDKYAQS